MWLESYMSNSIKFQSFLVPRIQNELNLTQFGSLNFNSNSVLNFEKLQWGNLFPISIPTHPYFIWKISTTEDHFWLVQIQRNLKIIWKKHYAASGPPVSLLFPCQAPLACPVAVWNSAAAFPYQRRAAPLVPVRAPTLEPHRERFPGYKTPSPHRPPFLFSQWSNARLRPGRHAGEEASRGWAGQAAPDSLAVGLRAKFGPTAGFIFLLYFRILLNLRI
jgi:hypothetical protein